MEGTVITKKGILLLTKLIATKGTLSLTRASVGTGKLMNGYDPASMIGMINYKMDAEISKCKANGDTAEVTMQISSVGIETGFTITEIGIFAEDPDDGEILYAYIDLSDDPQYIYSEGGESVKFVEITMEIVIADGAKVTAYINPSSLVTREEFDERNEDVKREISKGKEELGSHVADLGNPHHVTKEHVGLGEADNTSDLKKPVSNAQQAAIDGAYQQATGYTNQKIAELIDSAPSTLDTLGEIAQAMKENRNVVVALDRAIGTKASQVEVDGHAANNTIHVTASEREEWGDKQTKTGDIQDNIITFESGDAIEPTGWANVALVTTKEKVSSLMRKFSLTVKNMRYLWKLMGNTSLSGIGDGTVTGAISSLNTGISKGIRDTGWITLNTDWGCRYRIKNGVFYLDVCAELSSDASIGRHNLGTIPMTSLKALNIPYIVVREAFNNGSILVSHSAPNVVEVDIQASTKWYSATVSIPVGYLS